MIVYSSMNTTDNTTLLKSNTEKGFYAIDVIFLPIKIISVFLILLSLVALTRTRRLPKTAKCLTTGLILFDCLSNITYIAPMFFNKASVEEIVFMKLGLGFVILSHLTVTMMAIDRLFAFQWPHIYLQAFRYSRSWKLIVAIWTMTFLFIHIDRTVICFHASRYPKTFSETCNALLLVTAGIVFVLIAVVPFCCYIQIYRIVRNQSIRISVRKRFFLRLYKSTSIILIYLVNILLTTILHLLIVFAISDKNIATRLYFIVILGNGLFDTCSYVLWFQECRLELLKILARCFPKLRNKIEPMRIRVFDIWTIHDNKQTLQKCRNREEECTVDVNEGKQNDMENYRHQGIQNTTIDGGQGTHEDKDGKLGTLKNSRNKQQCLVETTDSCNEIRSKTLVMDHNTYKHETETDRIAEMAPGTDSMVEMRTSDIDKSGKKETSGAGQYGINENSRHGQHSKDKNTGDRKTERKTPERESMAYPETPEIDSFA